jgi:hypothetical protein
MLFLQALSMGGLLAISHTSLTFFSCFLFYGLCHRLARQDLRRSFSLIRKLEKVLIQYFVVAGDLSQLATSCWVASYVVIIVVG